MKSWIETRLNHALILDHHLAGDVPAESRYIDTSAAASAEIIAQLIDELERQTKLKLYDSTISESLFMGIAADTGWFRFSNTRPFTLELAARLIRAGVDHSALYARLEQSDRLEKLALMQRAVASLRLLSEGRVAIMTLTARDFEQTGALLEETERFIDLPQFARKVQAVALLVEPPEPPKGVKSSSAGILQKQMIRISFRSKPGPHAINVSKLAQHFGGGGHARAAGAKIDATLEVATKQVSDAILHAMKTPG